MINQYFNETTFQTEQNLLDSLIVESIQIYGHEAYYIKRNGFDIDAFFGEHPLSLYDNMTAIEVYLKNTTSFAGSSEMFTKFGMVIEDQATFIVSASRFLSVIGGARPFENDLLYIQFTPTNRYLFEIKFVENKEQLFQLGKLYTYELRCEIMNYSNERVLTGVANTDFVAANAAYQVDLHVSTGTGDFTAFEYVYQGPNIIEATASASVTSWNVSTKTLSVQNLSGDFANNEPIIGDTSGASWTIDETPDTQTNDPLSDNRLLETEQSQHVKPIVNPRFN